MTEIKIAIARLIADFNAARDGQTVVARLDYTRGSVLPAAGARV